MPSTARELFVVIVAAVVVGAVILVVRFGSEHRAPLCGRSLLHEHVLLDEHGCDQGRQERRTQGTAGKTTQMT